MKKITELGISPTPWMMHKCSCDYDILGSNGFSILLDDYFELPNARFVAAAPKLYECLHEAITDECTECHQINDYESDIDVEWDMCKNCKVKKWRDALAEAAGESEVK